MVTLHDVQLTFQDMHLNSTQSVSDMHKLSTRVRLTNKLSETTKETSTETSTPTQSIDFAQFMKHDQPPSQLPPHIPAHMPQLPLSHSYKKTPIYQRKVVDAATERMSLSMDARKGQGNLKAFVRKCDKTLVDWIGDDKKTRSVTTTNYPVIHY